MKKGILDMKFKYAVDLPNPIKLDIDSEWICIQYFETKKEAIEFCKKYYGADDKGNINLISNL
jgi:hypothetical protein